MKKKNFLCRTRDGILPMSFFLVFTFCTTMSYAQLRNVVGTVTDSKTKEAIPGVSVWIKESAVGATTDGDGKFSVPVKGTSGVMAFSFIGYDPQEVPIGDKTVMNVQLIPSESSVLDEVVVIAYGQQKKESVIGAISTLNADKLKTPAGKISNVLAGQLAGIIGLSRSGEPGASSDFYIRGMSTFNSASQNPLVLVDGVERSLDLVDPEDIETFSILKDATATAVYGVRGANGVILITTRKGVEGKPKISFKFEAGVTGPTKMPKLVGSPQWAEMYNEAYGYTHDGKSFYTDDVIQKYRDGSDPDIYPNVDWIKELYKDWASNQQLNINIGGGGSMVRYYVAGSLYNEGSIFKEDKNKFMDYNSSINFSRVNFRANLDINVTPTTVVSLGLANIYEKKNSPASTGVWGYSFGTSPNAFPVKYSDGRLSGPTYGTGSNPYNLMNYSGYQEEYWNNSQSIITLNQDFSELITKGLRASVKFSYDALTSNSVKRDFSPETWLANGRDTDGKLIFNGPTANGQSSLGFEKGSAGNRVTYLEAAINYSRLFSETHRVEGLFLFNQRQRNNIVPGNALESLPYRTQGIAGRVTYAYSDRYFAEFNIGYNGSENFSPGKRFGVFPAGAAGWLVSNEKFWGDLSKTIDVFKIKGSFGIVGDDNIGGGRRFIYEGTIVKDASHLSGYEFNSQKNYGRLQIGEIANPNVGWEEVKKTNIGVELGFFKSRIRLQADYFYESRSGIFLQRASIPYYVGVTTNPYINVGRMKNRGVDASLEVNDQKVGKVTLNFRANFTYAANTILENDQPNYQETYRNRKGQRSGQIFGYQGLGFFKDQEEINNNPSQFGGALKPGDIRYKDINGDGVVNENDEIPIGYGSNPEIVYGFGVSARWKNFDLSGFFQGVGNVSLTMSGTSLRPFSTGSLGRAPINQDIYENRWHAGNMDNAKYPRLSDSDNTNNSKTSTIWLRNASFLRLKSAELGYTLPNSVTGKTFLTSVRIYASGLNLLTFSGFKLWDPERGSGDGGAYPPNRMISFGINIGM